MTGRLEGKVALVTGAAAGLGLGMARQFLAEGAKVVTADIQDEKGAMIEARFGEAVRYAHCDVTQEDEIVAALKSMQAAGELPENLDFSAITAEPPRDPALARLFPGHEVVGIDCTDLVLGLGTLHCMTQQQPASGEKARS